MSSISIDNFDDFLAIAREQTEPQRLLIVLAKRELPDGHTPAQAEQFEKGEGGHLAPIAGVDKLPEEIDSFATFADETKQVTETWDAIFVAALVGEAQLPSAEETDMAMEKVLHSIRDGNISNLLVFDNEGLPLELIAG